jgi:hypothetical protein
LQSGVAAFVRMKGGSFIWTLAGGVLPPVFGPQEQKKAEREGAAKAAEVVRTATFKRFAIVYWRWISKNRYCNFARRV